MSSLTTTLCRILFINWECCLLQISDISDISTWALGHSGVLAITEECLPISSFLPFEKVFKFRTEESSKPSEDSAAKKSSRTGTALSRVSEVTKSAATRAGSSIKSSGKRSDGSGKSDESVGDPTKDMNKKDLLLLYLLEPLYNDLKDPSKLGTIAVMPISFIDIVSIEHLQFKILKYV